MHECKLCKSNKMQDLLIGNDGVFLCRSCWKPVDDKDVHPKIFFKYKKLKR